MQHVPDGTVNPSATLYNTTMFAMAGLLAIAWISNWLIGPVEKTSHERLSFTSMLRTYFLNFCSTIF